MTLCRFLPLVLLTTSLACGSSDDSGSSSGTDSTATGSETSGGVAGDRPTDASAEAIGAFLADMGYMADTWTAETPSPREKSDEVSPHDRVRVFLNDILIASQVAGNGGNGPPHDDWSMAVKELFDASDVLVGQAAMVNAVEDGTAEWTYYCWGPAGRCGTGEPEHAVDAPIWGQGLDVPCGSCHGGNVFTEIP